MPFPTNFECIMAAETALGVQLPFAWQERLLRDNGGELELADERWQVFPAQDLSDRKRAIRTANHLVLENHGAREWRGFPAEAIAVGANGAGDFLVLFPTGGTSQRLDDRIYRWDHETGGLDEVGLCADFS